MRFKTEQSLLNNSKKKKNKLKHNTSCFNMKITLDASKGQAQVKGNILILLCFACNNALVFMLLQGCFDSELRAIMLMFVLYASLCLHH